MGNVVPGNWGVAENGIYFFDFGHASPGAGTLLKFYSFATRELSLVRAIPQVVRRGTSQSLAVSRDGR
jgi:hypothetical protein